MEKKRREAEWRRKEENLRDEGGEKEDTEEKKEGRVAFSPSLRSTSLGFFFFLSDTRSCLMPLASVHGINLIVGLETFSWDETGR